MYCFRTGHDRILSYHLSNIHHHLPTRTKQAECSSNDYDFYLTYSRFESLPRHRLLSFSWSSSVPPVELRNSTLNWTTMLPSICLPLFIRQLLLVLLLFRSSMQQPRDLVIPSFFTAETGVQSQSSRSGIFCVCEKKVVLLERDFLSEYFDFFF